jgi:serine/threonine protein kinase
MACGKGMAFRQAERLKAMNDEKWNRVKTIFAEVADLPPADRSGRIHELCGDDDSLLRHVSRLLECDAAVNDFIERPAFSIANSLPDSRVPIGRHIGNYRVVSEIGRGGMGTVFLAERDDGEFRQNVAIKVVSSPFLGFESLTRFRQERQILAGLNHPNIAKLLDGGVTDDGLPYLVMEYVEGEPLIDHARHNDLSMDRKLKMFLKICRAVAHAHQNLIIHRDIKPSNIIVTNDGEPKLLDFGLAKILDLHSTVLTATNYRALTPAYASPEQLRGEKVNVASDIFSLGVVFYEFITGERPFESDSSVSRLVSAGPDKREPEKPSSRLMRSLSAGKNFGGRRSLERHLADVRGDVDNIILKALREEPEHRYASVEQFAADIERHLDGLPITATEPTFAYRASKFISRNRPALIGASLVILAVILGILATLWQARIAANERDLARREKEKAEKLNVFMQSILSSASPAAKGKDAKVLEVMDDAAARIEAELAGQPELMAKALITIGATYNELGIPDRSEPLLRKALSILESDDSSSEADVAEATAVLAMSLISQYKLEEGAELAGRVVSMERSLGPERYEKLARALFILGETDVRRGRFADAETALSESISLCDQSAGQTTDCAFYRISFGRAKRFAGDLDGAEKIFRETLTMLSLAAEKNGSHIAAAQLNLGEVLLQRGKYQPALDQFISADSYYRDRFGESLNLALSQYYIARAYFRQEEYEKAVEHSRSAIAIAEKLNWRANSNYVGALVTLSLSLAETGESSEALRQARNAVAMAEKHLNPADIRAIEARDALEKLSSAKARSAR